MHRMKRLFLVAFAALTPAALWAAEPAAGAAAPATPVATTEASAAAPAAADSAAEPAAKAPAFDYAKPVDGVGQPVNGGYDFQPQVTKNGEYALWINNAILLPMMAVVSLLVLGLMLWIMARYRRKANPVPSKTSHNTLIEVIWTAVPALTLLGISVPSLDLLAQQYAPPPANALTVKVTGYQWYWGYAYPDNEIPEIISKMLPHEQAVANGEPPQLAVDNRMVVPVGRTVKLIITGADVIHSFAVPALWTKMDAVPGRLNEISFKAEETGVYYGQCSELCGVDHGFMPIAVEVVSEERFAQWVASVGGKMPGTAPAAATPAAAVTPAATPMPAAAAPVAAPAAN